ISRFSNNGAAPRAHPPNSTWEPPMHPATTEKPNVTPFPVPWAVKLVDRLHALYGAQFLRQWEGIDKRALALAWAEDLAGYTGDEIARGLAACKAKPFPPTLPEFLLLCRPTLNAEAAYHEAVAGMVARNSGERGEWSHPGIYWAAVRVTSHDLLSMGWQAIRARWEAAYRDVMSKGKWDPVPDPAPARPAPGQTHLSREQQRQAVAHVRSVAAGTNPAQAGQKREPKAWARRILANPAGKTPAVIAAAQRALEVREAEK